MRDEGSFTWRNAHIAEIEGEIAGALIGYPIDDPVDPRALAEAPAIIRPLAELEAKAPGHWYVNVLAVFPEFRGQGIGSALLDEAERLGGRSGTKGMAIIVSSANEGAFRLYERHGYAVRERRPIEPFPGYRRGGDWVLLTKPHR
jgi:ribosomal protein S18 acetylase RimI-like enzyme